jgi:hypothetical protein
MAMGLMVQIFWQGFSKDANVAKAYVIEAVRLSPLEAADRKRQPITTPTRGNNRVVDEAVQ